MSDGTGRPGDDVDRSGDTSSPGELADLGARARQRAGAAALTGWLLMAEPGPDLAEHVAAVPALAALADPAAAVDFERLLLRQVPPYESVFRSDDGRRGGPVAARVADAYDEFGIVEHLDGRWRIGGPDHLGLELRAQAHLVAAEAAAWEAERPDEAATAVENERRFLAEHLAPWAEMAIDALLEAADGSVYVVLFEAVRDLVRREIDLLRPAPVLDVAVTETVAIGRLGPARLARHLLAPERCGFWLGQSEIAAGAGRLGFPWRPMDGRANLTPLVRAASDAGEMAELVAPWRAVAAAAADRHLQRAGDQPGAEAIWRSLEQRARTTAEMLAGLGATVDIDDDTEIVVRISGGDPAAAIDLLVDAGYAVEAVDIGDADGDRDR